MSGSCWRLLAVFSLVLIASIFIATIVVASIVVTPAVLHGQDRAANRSPLSEPAVAPLITSKPSPLAHSSPFAPPVPIPPNLLRSYPVIPQPPTFRHLVRAAGIIFSGRVVSIGLASSAGQQQASTAITFEVERALRGASPGQNLTIHEWAGLWTRSERYHVGEQVLLFLYSPSKLGLTSPVGRGLGRFAVDSRGRIVMNAEHVRVLAADPILAKRTGEKSVVPYADFVRAVQRWGGE